MKIIDSKRGPYKKELQFYYGEIDEIMQEHYLKFKKDDVDRNKPAIDMDRFFNNYLLDMNIEFDPQKKDIGPDVLGKTTFYPDGLELIQISNLIDKDQNLGRYNFTLAHEIFHALHHRPLFGKGDYSEIKCLNRDIFPAEGRKYNLPLHEMQANSGAAALLMPKDIFIQCYNNERNAYGIRSNHELLENQDRFKAVVGYLSKTFNASKHAVRIRLSHLKMLQDETGHSVESVEEILRGMGVR